MLRLDTGFNKGPSTIQVETLYPATGSVPKFWCEYFEKGVFI